MHIYLSIQTDELKTTSQKLLPYETKIYQLIYHSQVCVYTFTVREFDNRPCDLISIQWSSTLRWHLQEVIGCGLHRDLVDLRNPSLLWTKAYSILGDRGQREQQPITTDFCSVNMWTVPEKPHRLRLPTGL